MGMGGDVVSDDFNLGSCGRYFLNPYLCPSFTSTLLLVETSHGGRMDSQEDEISIQDCEKEEDAQKGYMEEQFALAMDVLNESKEQRKEHDVDELDAYSRLPLLDIACCPLQWWKTNAASFPRLSIIARNLLCAMPTSVPSETLFSHVAARVQEVRRCSLNHFTQINLVLMNRWFREMQRRDEHPSM